jgi:hypothetical protein
MTIKKFAGIVDNDIFTIITVDTELQGLNAERLIAGLSSEPIFVEIPSNLDVNISWTWNGTEFVEG